jgi:hypothetical protein
MQFNRLPNRLCSGALLYYDGFLQSRHALFAGHLISASWQQKHAFRAVTTPDGFTPSLAFILAHREGGEYLGSWWKLKGVEVITVESTSYQTRGSKARLNLRDQAQYDKKRQEVRDRLNNISKKCRDFLAAAGLKVEDVLNAVNLQRAYDGEASTISMSDAGYYNDLSGMDQKRRLGLLNQPVGEYIHGRAKALTAKYVGGGATNTPLATVEERSDVYFRIDYGNGFFGLGAGYGAIPV